MTGSAAVLAVEIGDPDATRTVIAIVALLVVMGLGLVMLAFWQRRQTRPDPGYLAPLEIMGERAWRRGDPVWQRRRLDEVRPEDAEPLRKAAAPPHLDEAFDAGPTSPGFDDLRGDDGDDMDRAGAASDGEPSQPERGAGLGEATASTTSDGAGPDQVEAPTSTPDASDADERGAEAPSSDDPGRAVVPRALAGDRPDWPPLPPAVAAGVATSGLDGPDPVVADRDTVDPAPDDPVRADPDPLEHEPEHLEVAEPTDAADRSGSVSEDDDESRTPIASRRPWLELSDRDIDPEALRRAMEELDAELGRPPREG